MTYLEKVSEWYESTSGCDSIKTIRNNYYRTEGGAIKCCWPGCEFIRRSPEDMWRHIHFSRQHMSDRRTFVNDDVILLKEVIRRYDSSRQLDNR